MWGGGREGVMGCRVVKRERTGWRGSTQAGCDLTSRRSGQDGRYVCTTELAGVALLRGCGPQTHRKEK
jgi:hypothetical protein